VVQDACSSLKTETCTTQLKAEKIKHVTKKTNQVTKPDSTAQIWQNSNKNSNGQTQLHQHKS
jgi:hypothetical protein